MAHFRRNRLLRCCCVDSLFYSLSKGFPLAARNPQCDIGDDLQQNGILKYHFYGSIVQHLGNLLYNLMVDSF